MSMKAADEPIVIEGTFGVPIDVVWSAITDPDHMRKWFFESMPDFQAVEGFEVEFDVRSETRVFPHQWRVTRVVQGSLIEYNWKYGGYIGDSFVVFELDVDAGVTRLQVTHRVVEDFQEDVPEFTRESCVGGWRYFIKNRLKEYLENSCFSFLENSCLFSSVLLS